MARNANSKSSSLAPATRKRLVAAICQSVSTLSSILGSSSSTTGTADGNSNNNTAVVSQDFRDALSCHLYMLFSIMHFTESECKSIKSLNMGTTTATTTAGGKKKKLTPKEQERRAEAEQLAATREQCARSMLAASRSMSAHANRLWKRGVPDENVVNLPCRIAYQILESATGVQARKACCGTEALGMIAATVNSAPDNGSLLNTIVAALVDLLHSYEHMASLVAELCTMVHEQPTNRLAIELMREIGRMDMSGAAAGGGGGGEGGNAASAAAVAAGGKASGVRNVAPFLPELASRRPRLVLSQISLILPHLDCEPYQLRSAIVATIGNILTKVGQADGSEDEEQQQQQQQQQDQREGDMDGTNSEDGREGSGDNAGAESAHRMSNLGKGRSALLDILTERVRDSSSFTRVAVLKAWATVVESDCLPLERFLLVTALAISRLQDKTVMVRRSAMQVSSLYYIFLVPVYLLLGDTVDTDPGFICIHVSLIFFHTYTPSTSPHSSFSRSFSRTIPTWDASILCPTWRRSRSWKCI